MFQKRTDNPKRYKLTLAILYIVICSNDKVTFAWPFIFSGFTVIMFQRQREQCQSQCSAPRTQCYFFCNGFSLGIHALTPPFPQGEGTGRRIDGFCNSSGLTRMFLLGISYFTALISSFNMDINSMCLYAFFLPNRPPK